jgi:hypothetical protein
MDRTAFITTQKKQEHPILIVDKNGIIGAELAKKLKDESLVVFVSKNPPEEIDNVIHVPFVKKFPTIPDNIYSHIFLVDENLEITKDVLQAFVKKAKNDNSALVLCVWKEHATSDFINDFIFSYDKAKIAIYGDIFAKNFIYNPHTQINKFITQIKTFGKIKVPGDGMDETTVVYFDDVVFGILETLFAEGGENRIFYIFPKHKITLLSLAHMFQKQEPNLQIDFAVSKEEKKDNFFLQNEGVYILGETYDVEDKIKKIEFENITTVIIKEEAVYKDTKKNRINFKAIFLAFIFFLFLPLISTLIFSLIGLNSLLILRNDLENGNIFSSKPAAIFASKSFSIALSSSNLLLEEASVLGQEDKVNFYINKIAFGNDISEAAVSLIDSSEKFKDVFTGVSKNSSSDFLGASVELKSALFLYNKEKELGLIPESITNKLSDLVNLASTTIDLWPDMAGFNSQKTYLVLFQNNMELRPGGGFIGSYGILTVKNGKVLSFKINDVYDADGQLKSHVEPPFPIRRYLPSIHWYLRDSNFDVDYSKGAVASAVFLNAEMHQGVDGVIGVDLSFVKNIISAIGPVKVVDYNQTVNSDNLFQITQDHARNEFFPGSTQKKDFLRSLFTSIQNKISQEKNISYANLIQALSKGIYEKHVLFAFNNINEQAVFSVNGWASALIDERPLTDTQINDFVGINEANLGINKVNYFVTRSLSQNVSIQNDGSVAENLTVAFKNTAPKNSSGGVYKNYLRLILPLGAKITKIKIDNQEQKIITPISDPGVYEKKGFKPPSGLEVESQNEKENTIYGFLVILQPGDLRTIDVEYALAQKLNLSKADFNYNLKFFKQPGIDSYPYDFSVSFPKNLKVLDAPGDVKISGQNAILSAEILRDMEVNIHLSPK